MNGFLIFILVLLVAQWILNLVVEKLNLGHVTTEVPDEFKGVYDDEKYRKSQLYLRENTRFELLTSTIYTLVTIAFILLGGFKWVNDLALSAGGNMIVTGLLFAGILALLSQVLHLPASIYDTFVIEERYGFNKTTPKVFLLDQVKSILLTALLGALVFSALLWFFASAGKLAWVYSWIAITVFQLVIIFVAPVWIMPLFNKFTPLEDGALRESISNYAKEQGFALQGIFKMDGSKRSTKSNAYFTGFGNLKRIVMFDTLIEKHKTEELVAILAHEVGHYKLKHIVKMVLGAILSTGLMLFILSLFLHTPALYEAFKVPFEPIGETPPIYAGMVFFGFLYTPISMVISLYNSMMSRKHEFEADAFSVETYGHADDFIQALKNLSVDNLSNLTPHPLKVFLEYSHPPVLERIKAIRK